MTHEEGINKARSLGDLEAKLFWEVITAECLGKTTFCGKTYSYPRIKQLHEKAEAMFNKARDEAGYEYEDRVQIKITRRTLNKLFERQSHRLATRKVVPA